MSELCIMPGGRLIASVFSDGMYGSTNRGETWQPISTALLNSEVRALAVDTANYAYAGAADGLYISRDEGRRWVRADTGGAPVEVNALTFAFTGGVVLAGGSDGLYRTVDSGWTWRRDSTIGKGRVTACCRVRWGDCYAAGDSGRIFRSADTGATWKACSPIPSRGSVRAIVGARGTHRLFAAVDGGVWYTGDDGVTWNALPGAPPDVTALACDSTSSIIAGSGSGGIFVLDSNAMESVPRNDGLAERSILSVAVDAVGHLYAGTANGFFYFDRRSSAWIPANTGLDNTRVTAIAVAPNRRLYAGTFGSGVYRNAFQTTDVEREEEYDGMKLDLSDILPGTDLTR
jgi:ligand-binding sensor domain-containing protein